MTLSIKPSLTICHYAECHYAECHYAECHYAECHYAECQNAEYRVLFNVMLSVMVPEVTDIDNHSSLLRCRINYDRKRFYSTCPRL
jgi:hypothetical protein